MGCFIFAALFVAAFVIYAPGIIAAMIAESVGRITLILLAALAVVAVLALPFVLPLLRTYRRTMKEWEGLNVEGNEEKRREYWLAINRPVSERPAKVGDVLVIKDSYLKWLRKAENRGTLEKYKEWWDKEGREELEKKDMKQK